MRELSLMEQRYQAVLTVLLVAGGDVLYLCHRMRQSGLIDLRPTLSETV